MALVLIGYDAVNAQRKTTVVAECLDYARVSSMGRTVLVGLSKVLAMSVVCEVQQAVACWAHSC